MSTAEAEIGLNSSSPGNVCKPQTTYNLPSLFHHLDDCSETIRKSAKERITPNGFPKLLTVFFPLLTPPHYHICVKQPTEAVEWMEKRKPRHKAAPCASRRTGSDVRNPGFKEGADPGQHKHRVTYCPFWSVHRMRP